PPRVLPSFPTRRSSDLLFWAAQTPWRTSTISPYRVRCSHCCRASLHQRCENESRTLHATSINAATCSSEPRRPWDSRMRCVRSRSEEHTSELQSRENLV